MLGVPLGMDHDNWCRIPAFCKYRQIHRPWQSCKVFGQPLPVIGAASCIAAAAAVFYSLPWPASSRCCSVVVAGGSSSGCGVSGFVQLAQAVAVQQGLVQNGHHFQVRVAIWQSQQLLQQGVANSCRAVQGQCAIRTGKESHCYVKQHALPPGEARLLGVHQSSHKNAVQHRIMKVCVKPGHRSSTFQCTAHCAALLTAAAAATGAFQRHVLSSYANCCVAYAAENVPMLTVRLVGMARMTSCRLKSLVAYVCSI